MHPIGVAASFAILCLHQEQLEVIGCSQVLRDTRLTDSFLPEDRTDLATQAIPALLVIVHNRPVKIPFQFLKSHSPCFCRCFSIMNTVAGIRQTSLKALSHPAKESFHSPFCTRTIRWGLLGDDTKPIYQHLACSLRREDFPSIMKDHCWFAKARPGVLTTSLEHETIFRLQHTFDQAHVVFLFEGTEREYSAHDGGSFHTHEDRRMNLTRDRNPIWGDHIEFHAVFIDLSQLRGGGNGEGKGAGRLPIAKRSRNLFAHSAHLGLLFENLHVVTN